MIGPVWPVGAGCYSQAALPMPLSKPLYVERTRITDVVSKSYDVKTINAVNCNEGQYFYGIMAEEGDRDRNPLLPHLGLKCCKEIIQPAS